MGDYVELVKHRLRYVQDQVDRRIPAQIERLEAERDRLVRIGRQEHAVVAVGDRIADLMDEADAMHRELESGAVVVSWSCDATFPEAQAQIRRDDADMAAARASYDRHRLRRV